MKNETKFKSIIINIITCLLFFLAISFSTTTYAGIDTTLFRIHVVQDSVYAGDTVDVDFFIGNGSLLGSLNILKEFEIEIVTDTSLMEQDKIKFQLDSTSLASFFGTLISNITTVTNIDLITGKLNIKSNSNNIGNGNARIGRGKYIVQDNAAGRQYMRYGFSKAISKDLLGFNNPIKLMIDSVLIIDRVQIPTAIKMAKNNNIRISPNPVKDIIYIGGANVQRYKLITVDGKELIQETKGNAENLQLNLNSLNAGAYILFLQVDEMWSSYKIAKE